MRERFFEAAHTNDKKAIQQDLESAGINSPTEWREAFDHENENTLEIDNRSFDVLLQYLGEEKKQPDKEAKERFSKTTDDLERLELLRTMSIADATACIRDFSTNKGSYKYLADRLDFYQNFTQGTATRKRTEREWDGKQYVEVTKEYPLDASEATPETIRSGLMRDMMFAAMIGTPELAIYKIADKRLKEKQISTAHMPELRGYHSGIHEGSIGYAYPLLRDIYTKAKKRVEVRTTDQELDEETLEHKSVLLATKWLEEAMDYNDPRRTRHSPYASSVEEAVAWARLGEGVKRQLRGMRRKIQGIDLHNIDRFIGKSGDGSYDQERKRLFGQIKFLKTSSDEDEKDKLTDRENAFAVKKQHKWYEGEIERLAQKLERSKSEVERANVPEDEKQLQLESVLTRHEVEVARIEDDYQSTLAGLQGRSREDLLTDLEQRQELVNERYEKRKSLGQKALDLHFQFNHPKKISRGDYEEKPYAGIVDWINYAPLGTIKRSHKMLRQGIKEEAIVEYALADIIAGARGATREDLQTVHGLVEKAKGQDWEAKQKLAAMMKVGNILSLFNYELSLDEVADLADKNFNGMTEALKLYDLDQVKQFMSRGISLESVTTARKITEKFGHDLSPDIIAEMASHDIHGLEDALRSFDLDATMTLLKEDAKLPVAVAVLNNTRQFGYELTTAQIANVAKNVNDINDFNWALQELPLAEVERLFTTGIPYREFVKVKGALEKHGYPADFKSSLAISQKLSTNDRFNNEYDSLDLALQAYTLEEIEKVIAKKMPLSVLLAVRESLQKKGVESGLEETIQFAQYAGDWQQGWNVTQAIDTFGIEDARKIASKSCRLDKALEVHKLINSTGLTFGGRDNDVSDSLKRSLKAGGIDVLIAIAKAGNIEAAAKTIEAGFTVEEITRFPFLISPMVAKK